jgi:hypothetical protein
MTLKPGQKKEIVVQIKKNKVKIKELENLNKEIDKLKYLSTRLSYNKLKSKLISNSIKELQNKISVEITNLKNQQQEFLDKLNLAALPLAAKIAKECSAYIAVYKSSKKILLRGMKSTNPDIFMARSRDDRRTLTSDEIGQQAYDMMLTAIGISAKRSNSIFTTSDSNQAKTYGDLYMIFPKNTAEFSWSQTEPDLVIEEDEVFNHNNIDKLENAVRNFLKKNNKKSYWAFNYYNPLKSLKELQTFKFPNADKITLEQLYDLKGLKNRYAPTNKNLSRAIQSGGEVLISGEYYALKFDTFKGILPMLGIDYNYSE